MSDLFEDFKVFKNANLLSMKGGLYSLTSSNKADFFNLFLKTWEKSELYFTENPGRVCRFFVDVDDKLSKDLLPNLLIAIKDILLKNFVLDDHEIRFDVISNNKFDYKLHIYPYIMAKPNTKTEAFIKENLRLCNSKDLSDDEITSRLKELRAPRKTRLCIDKEVLKKIFDKLAYLKVDNASKIRMIGACKKEGKSKGIYIPEEGITLESLKSYSILPSGSVDYWLRLKPKREEKWIPKPVVFDESKVSISEKHIHKFLDKALEVLPGNRWDDWYYITKVCSSYNYSPQKIEEWASRFDNYIEGETSFLMGKSQDNREKWSLGVIWKKLKNELGDNYENWKAENSPYRKRLEMYSMTDKYTLGKYTREVSFKKFETKEDAWDYLVEKLSLFARIVIMHKPIVFYKESAKQPIVESGEDLRKSYKHLVVSYNASGKNVNMNIFDPLYLDKRFWYGSVTFDPLEKGSNVLNMWRGFEAQKCDQNDSDGLKMILNHIRTCWANDNEEVYDYIIQWFAHIVQEPHKKTRKCIVLYSHETQIGKGILLQFITEYLFGDSICEKLEQIKDLTSKFNDFLNGKLLIWVDEISSEKAIWKTSWDTLKSLISENKISIEKKYHGRRDVRSYNNFIMLTNNPHYIRLEQHDSRYVVFEVSSRYKDNTKYFSDLASYFTPETGKAFYDYLMSIHLEPLGILSTEIREEMIETNLSSVDRFVIEHIGNYEELTGVRTVYEHYKTWCVEVGESPLKERHFTIDMKRNKYVENCRTSTKRGYKF